MEGEVADIEGKGAFHRSQVEGGTYLTPLSFKLGGLRSGPCQGRPY